MTEQTLYLLNQIEELLGIKYTEDQNLEEFINKYLPELYNAAEMLYGDNDED